jgi:hypothetical protein
MSDGITTNLVRLTAVQRLEAECVAHERELQVARDPTQLTAARALLTAKQKLRDQLRERDCEV